MIMPETNPATSVQGCILEKLPVELRLSIYEFFFQGSQIRATITETDKSSFVWRRATKFFFKGSQIHATLAETDKSSFTWNPTIILRHSEHFNLLLSCRAIYNEAFKTYWSKTVLRLERSRLWIFIGLHEYFHCLCTSLPKTVKANVKHIRGMVLPETRFVEENPSLTASALLGPFKELVTCEIWWGPCCPVDMLVECTMFPNDKGFSRFKMRSGPSPKEHLARCYGLDANAGVTFLSKGTIRYNNKTWPWMLDESPPRFWNFSTGLNFEDRTHKLDDEEGYEKVLQAKLSV